jgi:mTERF domain-containing protein
MSRPALKVVAFFSEEKIAVKVQNLENTFRWSEVEAGKAPDVLTMPKDMLQRKSDFLISELGLEPNLHCLSASVAHL